MSFIGRNIKKIRTVKKLSQSNFADLFDISRASIGSYEEERAYPKIDKIIDIANYFSINLDLLLKKELTVNEISGFKLTDNKMKTGNENNLIKKRVTPNKQITYVNNENNSEFIKHLVKRDTWHGKTIELPPNIDPNTSVAFEHNDNAMNINDDGISMSDIVFAEFIETTKMFNNYLYIVIIKDYIYLRKANMNGDIITLEAVNKNFHPIVINKKDILAIYKINGAIKKTINHYIK